MVWFGLTVAVVFCAAADEPPAELLNKFVAESREEAQKMVPVLQREIAEQKLRLQAAKKGRIDPRAKGVTQKKGPGGVPVFAFADVAAKKVQLQRIEEKIAELTERLERIKAGEFVPRNLPYEKLEVGQIGTLVDNRVRVRQVIGDREFLGEVTCCERRPAARGQQVYTATDFFPVLCYFSGFPTERFTDGSLAVVKDVLWVSGTKRYQTPGGGSKTVLMLRPVVLTAER